MTEHDDRQAELLDRYGSVLVGDGDPTPPAGMDGSLAATARAVHRELRAEAPRDAFVARLRRRIEEPAARSFAQRRSTRWPGSIPRRLAAGGLLAASLAAILLVAGLTRGGDGATAAEILRAASAAAASPETAGVRSVEMTAVSVSVLEVRGLPPTANYLGDREITFRIEMWYRSHVWYQAPDRLRKESVDITPETTGGKGLWPVVQIWNGTEHIIYFVDSALAQIFDLDRASVRQWLWVGWPGPENIETLLGEAARCYDQPRVVGEELIAGRPTHWIDLGQSHCYPFEGMRRVIWIDQETAFVLKHEEYRPDGELSSRVEVTSIEYNVPIDPERFEFTPPPGVEVEDMRR